LSGDATPGTSASAALVSVVVPCYNHGRFLPDALESIARQTHPHVEVVVIDDGSTDDTATIARSSAGVQYRHQPNAGLAAARNAGLEASTAAFIVFLDADDRLLPEAIATNVAFLEADPRLAFVSGEHRYVDEEGRVSAEWSGNPVAEGHYASLLRRNYIGMIATVMFRRGVLVAQGGFDTGLEACEDYDLYLRIARVHPVAAHASVVAEYRRHSAAMSNDGRRMLRAAVRAHSAQRRISRATGEWRAAYREGASFWRRYYGAQILADAARSAHRGDYASACRSAWTALRYAPVETLGILGVRKRDDGGFPTVAERAE
jgi:glycosyltransferase involved in cell wall biosynthesis